MKKIISFLFLLLLYGCSWNYENGNINKNIQAEKTKKQQEIKEEVKKQQQEKLQIENKIASEILYNFLHSNDFDIKKEIEKTKEKYNDSLGPILEFEHQKEELSQTGVNISGSGTYQENILNYQSGSQVNKPEKKEIYSGEANIEKQNPEQKSDIIKYTTKTKKGKSGSYTMYIGVSDNCIGGLEMIDLQNTKKWLFKNNCEKIIYDFELAVGAIKVYYNDSQGAEKIERISIQ